MEDDYRPRKRQKTSSGSATGSDFQPSSEKVSVSQHRTPPRAFSQSRASQNVSTPHPKSKLRAKAPTVSDYSSSSSNEPLPKVEQSRRLYHISNVYTAVAGRHATHGYMPDQSHPHARTRDIQTHSDLPVAPADVLLSSTAASGCSRDFKKDQYGAHRWLGQTQRGDVYRSEYCDEKGLKEVRKWTGKGVGGIGFSDEELRKEEWAKELRRATGMSDKDSAPNHEDRKIDKSFLLPQAELTNPRESLPSSDLLKGIHRYCSHFFAALVEDPAQSATEQTSTKLPEQRPDGPGQTLNAILNPITSSQQQGKSEKKDAAGHEGKRVAASGNNKAQRLVITSHKSMDETALLAFGILLEETCRSYVDAPASTFPNARERQRNRSKSGSASQSQKRSTNPDDSLNTNRHHSATNSGTDRNYSAKRAIGGEGWRALMTGRRPESPSGSSKHDVKSVPARLLALSKHILLDTERSVVQRGPRRKRKPDLNESDSSEMGIFERLTSTKRKRVEAPQRVVSEGSGDNQEEDAGSSPIEDSNEEDDEAPQKVVSEGSVNNQEEDAGSSSVDDSDEEDDD